MIKVASRWFPTFLFEDEILISNRLSVVAASQPRMFQPHISTINHEIQSKSHETRVKSAPWNCQRYESENVYIKFARLVACYVITTVPQIKHNRILQSKIPCPSRDPQDVFWSDQDYTALTLTCVQTQNMSSPQIYNNVLNIRTAYQHHRHSNIFHLPRQRPMSSSSAAIEPWASWGAMGMQSNRNRLPTSLVSCVFHQYQRWWKKSYDTPVTLT